MIQLHHIYQKGENNNVIISLHGTGGNATSLFSISSFVDKNATLLGIEGRCVENGMLRFFRRFADGTFNYKSLKEESENLFENIKFYISKYHLENHNITIIGYSNGANILLNLLKLYKLDFNLVVLLHPALGDKNIAFKNQGDLLILMTNGRNDPFIDVSEIEVLVEQFDEAKLNYQTYIHDFDHPITYDEITTFKKLYTSLFEKE